MPGTGKGKAAFVSLRAPNEDFTHKASHTAAPHPPPHRPVALSLNPQPAWGIFIFIFFYFIYFFFSGSEGLLFISPSWWADGPTTDGVGTG